MHGHNEVIVVKALHRIAKSLENIDKTLSEPKNFSTHRVVALRKISNAVAYIDVTSVENEETINANETPMEVIGVLIHTNKCLDYLRKTLLSRE